MSKKDSCGRTISAIPPECGSTIRLAQSNSLSQLPAEEVQSN